MCYIWPLKFGLKMTVYLVVVNQQEHLVGSLTQHKKSFSFYSYIYLSLKILFSLRMLKLRCCSKKKIARACHVWSLQHSKKLKCDVYIVHCKIAILQLQFNTRKKCVFIGIWFSELEGNQVQPTALPHQLTQIGQR